MGKGTEISSEDPTPAKSPQEALAAKFHKSLGLPGAMEGFDMVITPDEEQQLLTDPIFVNSRTKHEPGIFHWRVVDELRRCRTTAG